MLHRYCEKYDFNDDAPDRVVEREDTVGDCNGISDLLYSDDAEVYSKKIVVGSCKRRGL